MCNSLQEFIVKKTDTSTIRFPFNRGLLLQPINLNRAISIQEETSAYTKIFNGLAEICIKNLKPADIRIATTVLLLDAKKELVTKQKLFKAQQKETENLRLENQQLKDKTSTQEKNAAELQLEIKALKNQVTTHEEATKSLQLENQQLQATAASLEFELADRNDDSQSTTSELFLTEKYDLDIKPKTDRKYPFIFDEFFQFFNEIIDMFSGDNEKDKGKKDVLQRAKNELEDIVANASNKNDENYTNFQLRNCVTKWKNSKEVEYWDLYNIFYTALMLTLALPTLGASIWVPLIKDGNLSFWTENRSQNILRRLDEDYIPTLSA